MQAFHYAIFLLNNDAYEYNMKVITFNLHQVDLKQKKTLFSTQNNIMIVLISRGPDLFSTKPLSLYVTRWVSISYI